MATAEINVDNKALAAKLAEMRAWLDERRYEASGFTYFPGPASLVLRVTFGAADEHSHRFADRGNLHLCLSCRWFGPFAARIGDKVIDGSTRARLLALKASLGGAAR